MQVKLLAYTPEPEKTVACAAKLCYAAADIDTVYEGLTEEKTASFLEMLQSIGHESPIEHASFTFGIEGVSRSLLAQITRHRIASFSVQSQRYVREDGFEFVLPPEIAKIPEAKEEFLRAMEEDAQHYQRLTELLKERHKQELLAAGETEKAASRKAEKQAIEDARFVLPNACTTKMICTMNARSLLPPLLQPRPVGDSGAGHSDAQGGAPGSPPPVWPGRPALPAGKLSRGEDVLRENGGGSGKIQGAVRFRGVCGPY